MDAGSLGKSRHLTSTENAFVGKSDRHIARAYRVQTRRSKACARWPLARSAGVLQLSCQARTLIDRTLGIQLRRHVRAANQVHILPGRQQAVLQLT